MATRSLNRIWNVLNKDGVSGEDNPLFRHSDSIFRADSQLFPALDILAPESQGPGFKYFCIEQLIRLIFDVDFGEQVQFHDPFNTYTIVLQNPDNHERDLAKLVTDLDGINLAALPWATDFFRDTWIQNPGNLERLAAATLSLSVLSFRDGNNGN